MQVCRRKVHLKLSSIEIFADHTCSASSLFRFKWSFVENLWHFSFFLTTNFVSWKVRSQTFPFPKSTCGCWLYLSMLLSKTAAMKNFGNDTKMFQQYQSFFWVRKLHFHWTDKKRQTKKIYGESRNKSLDSYLTHKSAKLHRRNELDNSIDGIDLSWLFLRTWYENKQTTGSTKYSLCLHCFCTHTIFGISRP